MTVEINKDFELMLVSAERYACGRRTYIVSYMCNYISSLLSHLSDGCIDCLSNDLRAQFEASERSGQKYLLGDYCDYLDWKKLYEKLSIEKERRNNDS